MASPNESFNQSLIATADGQVERSPVDVGARPLPIFGATIRNQSATNGALEMHIVDINGVQVVADATITASSSEQSVLSLLLTALGITTGVLPSEYVGAVCRVITADIYMGRAGKPDGTVRAGCTSVEPFVVGDIFTLGRVAQ